MDIPEAKYRELVEQVYAGNIIIGVDRPFARQLYTSVPMATIHDQTGESPYIEKTIVSLALYGAPVVLLVSFVIAGFAFHWWAIPIIPVAALFWFGYASLSVRGNAGIIRISYLLIAEIVLLFTNLITNKWIPGFFATYFFALWCSRFVYCSGTFFLRAFVLRNHRAFTSLADGLTIVRADDLY